MTLSHDVAGDGPALLLLHSSVCDRRMWDPQWGPLVDLGHRVVRCDLRGFGESPMATEPYRDTEDVAELLDRLGIEETAVVGSSGGGRVALRFAARWPERVTALALLCTAAPGYPPTAAVAEFGAREDALIEAGDIDGAVELNVRTWLGPDADTSTRDAVRRMQRRAFDVQLAAPEEFDVAEPEVDLARVGAPTLTVSGRHDLDHFRQVAADLATRLPAARHVELPWAGHLPGLERPAAVTTLVADFLRESVPAA